MGNVAYGPRRRRATMDRGARWLLVFGCIVVSACTPYQQERRTLSYDTADVPILAGGPLSPYALVIRPVIDQRPQRTVIQKPPQGPFKISQDNRIWYATSDEGFRTPVGVPQGVSEAIASHLSASQLCTRAQVSTADPPPGDLVLTATLSEFIGTREERDTSEGLVAMHGLIGLALLATQDADVKGRTKLDDIALTDARTGVVLWHGAAEGTIDEEVPLSPELAEAQAFGAANRSLRLAVDQLVRHLAHVQPAAGSAAPAGARP